MCECVLASAHCVWEGLGGPSLFKNFYSSVLITHWFQETSDTSASDTTREGVDRSTRAWESRQKAGIRHTDDRMDEGCSDGSFTSKSGSKSRLYSQLKRAGSWLAKLFFRELTVFLFCLDFYCKTAQDKPGCVALSVCTEHFVTERQRVKERKGEMENQHQ